MKQIRQFGIVLNQKVNDTVADGSLLATVYANDMDKAKIVHDKLLQIYKIT